MARDDVLLRLRTQGAKAAQGDLLSTGRAASRMGDQIDHAGRRAGATVRPFGVLRASARGVGGSFGVMARGIGGAVAALGGLYALGAGFKVAFDEATEAARVGAATAQVIRSTGRAANVTADQVGDLAGRISDYAGIDDEAIQAGENLLLTFTNLRNEAGRGNKVFDQAAVAATDMAVALGTDTRAAALMLGKALNDPARGYSRLMRSGVSFTDSQVRQIKALQKSGDVLGAQRIVLAEVMREFGGQARAQAQPIDKLRVSIGNVAESIGSLMLPAVNRAIGPMRRFADRVNRAINDRRLTFGERVAFVWRGTQRDLKPFLDDVEQWMDRARVGEKLADGVERATPVILDAAASAAGRAGETFVKAWLHTGPWGKLLTVGFLMTKLRAWGPAASLSAKLFGAAWRRTLGGSTAFEAAGAAAGRRAGAAATASAAGTAADGIGPSMTARQKAWARAGTAIGRVMGVAAGAALAAWAYQAAMERLGSAVEGLGEGGAADSDPIVRRTRERMDDPAMPARIAAWERANPALARRFHNRPSATLSDDLLADLVRSGYPGLTPGATGVPRDFRGAFPQATDRPPRARAGSERNTPIRPHTRTSNIDLRVNLDGRVVARNTVRHADDDGRWGWAD